MLPPRLTASAGRYAERPIPERQEGSASRISRGELSSEFDGHDVQAPRKRGAVPRHIEAGTQIGRLVGVRLGRRVHYVPAEEAPVTTGQPTVTGEVVGAPQTGRAFLGEALGVGPMDEPNTRAGDDTVL